MSWRPGAEAGVTEGGGRGPSPALRIGVAALAAALAAGCYGFSGGGGLPSHIRTASVIPVDNQTDRFGLSEVLTQDLLDAARDRLGLQLAAEGEADALIRATVRGYTDDAVNFEAREGEGADVFQRRVTITASVQIYDATREEVIWESTGVSGVGEYQPETESEDAGLEIALENLVQKIVNGAQSQW